MAATEQAGDPHRDYGIPATWGDVERVRLMLETQMARMETRLTAVTTWGHTPSPERQRAIDAATARYHARRAGKE